MSYVACITALGLGPLVNSLMLTMQSCRAFHKEYRTCLATWPSCLFGVALLSRTWTGVYGGSCSCNRAANVMHIYAIL